MGNVTSPLLPKTQRLLNDLGNRLKLARLRRGLQAKQVAQRAGMAPLTLRSIERGSSTVTFGAYIAVMQVLGLAGDLNSLAKEDEIGRHLQDAKLTQTKPRKRVDSKDDQNSDGMPRVSMYAGKAKGVHGTSVKPTLNGTSSIESQVLPPMPSPKKQLRQKRVGQAACGRETIASNLAAQIFRSDDK